MQQITERSNPKKSSTGTIYDTIAHVDGKLACNCPGWATKKPYPRWCKHIKDLLAKYKFLVYANGDYTYVRLNPNGEPVYTDRPQSVPLDPGNTVVRPLNANGSVASAKTKKTVPTPQVVSKPGQFIQIPEIDAPPPPGQFAVIPETDEDLAVFINPMLASPFPEDQSLAEFLGSVDTSLWVMEEKFDGHRKIVTVNDGVVKAWSRPGAGKDPLPWTLPKHIELAFAVLPTGTYDGELLIPGGRSYNVTDGKFAGKEVFVVFDLLSLLGQTVTDQRYDDRRAFLAEIFKKHQSPAVVMSESFPCSIEFVEAIWKRDGEGAIIKRRAAKYFPGNRSQDWVKVKQVIPAKMVVTGFLKGKLGPHAKIVVMNPLDGSTTKVKTKNNDWLAAFAKDADAYIGLTLWIEYQERTPPDAKHPAGSYRSPRADHWDDGPLA